MIFKYLQQLLQNIPYISSFSFIIPSSQPVNDTYAEYAVVEKRQKKNKETKKKIKVSKRLLKESPILGKDKSFLNNSENREILIFKNQTKPPPEYQREPNFKIKFKSMKNHASKIPKNKILRRTGNVKQPQKIFIKQRYDACKKA